jgi:hypothetical protein
MFIAKGYKRSLAHRIICEECNCRHGDCLLRLQYAVALPIVEGCINEIEHLTQRQKKEYMLAKVLIMDTYKCICLHLLKICRLLLAS